MVARITRSLFYLIFLLICMGAGWLILPASVHYQITEQYIFNSELADAQVALGVLLPRSGPYQAVEKVLVSWDGIIDRLERPPVDVLELQGRLTAGENHSAVVQYDVTLWQGPARWQADVQPFQRLPQVQIESDNPVLVSQAGGIVQGTGRTDAYRLFEWTAGYLSWPTGARLGDNQSALQAYQEKVGGCGEFAHLMTAFCRAAGISAQTVEGLALPAYPPLWSATAAWGHPGSAHAWVEVYSDGAWELADPSWASRLPLVRRLWFGRNDGSHLAYGEEGQVRQIYREIEAWARGIGAYSIGGMTAPLHFTAQADTEGVTLTPQVTLKVTWNGRWINTAALYLVGVAGMLVLERRIRKIDREV